MEKNKKLISLILFLLYIGCIILCAQETPRKYIAYQVLNSISIDGKAEETSWQKAPWSDLFIDIEGEKKPLYDTRIKMLWDQTHLYFFAQLEEPHVWANLKQRDTIIFYNNDFEIFIDPDGDTHNYYEYEMNALNTVWDLFLSKPYRNHGKVLGGWDYKDLQSAVAVQGTLNDPSDTDEGWSVEIAIPWSFYTDPGRKTVIPENKIWRLNFSRVNWDFDVIDGKYNRKKDPETGKFLHEYNWVWSPQQVINMHEPERWGYVFFSTKTVGDTSKTFEISKDEHIKWYLYELYRDLIKGDKSKKEWKSVNAQLQGPSKTLFGKSVTPLLEKHSYGFTLWAESPFTNTTLAIDEDGKFENFEK